ncbi:hypothetical protein NXC14_PA00555 (plasmid) [Rhizobium sp. NXC14]|nr:hypothetical protein NXC14_PA00555 [Rhizobium sp. NXC14]
MGVTVPLIGLQLRSMRAATLAMANPPLATQSLGPKLALSVEENLSSRLRLKERRCGAKFLPPQLH